jgi:hypothetical protein
MLGGVVRIFVEELTGVKWAGWSWQDVVRSCMDGARISSGVRW